MHWAGTGCVYPQHALGRGVSAQGRCLSGGVWQTPSLWTEWQTGVKSLPCRYFVACGKNLITSRHLCLYLSFWANCTSLKTNYHMTNLSQQFHLHHNFICTNTIHTRNGNKQRFLCHIYHGQFVVFSATEYKRHWPWLVCQLQLQWILRTWQAWDHSTQFHTLRHNTSQGT